MIRKNISNKSYSDGKQRIVFIHQDGEKLVINNAYNQKLNAQVKVNKEKAR